MAVPTWVKHDVCHDNYETKYMGNNNVLVYTPFSMSFSLIRHTKYQLRFIKPFHSCFLTHAFRHFKSVFYDSIHFIY